MKKLMMAAGLLLLGFGTSFAQNAVGTVTLQPKVGVNVACLTDEDAYEQGTGQRVKVKSFDFSIPMGLSYEINGLVFDARYNLGLSKIVGGFKYEGVKVQPDDKNSVFQLTIGYKFTL